MTQAATEDFLAADAAILRRALATANVPALMMTLLHLEGDDSVLDCGITPINTPLAANPDGLTPEDREVIRDRALRAALAFRQSGAKLSVPDTATLDRALARLVGQAMPAGHAAYLREELPFAGPNRPAWRDDETDPDARARCPVAVIGAGMSGILAGVRLNRAGYPFVIFEKSASLGGTWRDNDYPGCRVDTPNHIYSYSFAANHDWPARFSDRQTLETYLSSVAEAHGLTPHIRLKSEVEAAQWDETAGTWHLQLADGGTHEARAVVSAVGQLNRPKLPAIDGLDDFTGPAFHSARWEHGVDLDGKRVAVIGTGASATQFVPEIADRVGHLTILQRSPPWLVPTPDYVDAMPAEERWLLRNWPFYAEWYRMWLFRVDASDDLLAHLYGDADWPDNGAVSARNQTLRDEWTAYLKEQAQGDDDLFRQLLPDYPPGGKRPLRDNGSWVRTLRRENVTLRRDAIAGVAPNGIRMQDGGLIPADALIFGTGFEADRFFAPMRVTGRDGADLGAAMRDPRAYRGISVPGFPNFFAVYGPNTNTVVGAGIIFFAECTMRYIIGCLNHLVAEGRTSMDVRPGPFEAYNARIDAMNRERAWGMPGVDSWYKNAAGRVTQNWPDTHHAFWTMTLRPDPDDYDIR